MTGGGTTTGFVVDTSLSYASVVEEYSGTTLANGTLAARYDYGDDLVRMNRTTPSVSTSYYLYDGLGSTRQLVSGAGAVTDTWGYTAFGEQVSRTGSTVNSFLFNAQQFDQPTGTYYLRARYYDQSNGRFLSQDPFGGSDEDPISLHRYLYADVDPVDMVDPGGQDAGDISLGGLSAGSAGSATIDVGNGLRVGGSAGQLVSPATLGIYAVAGFTIGALAGDVTGAGTDTKEDENGNKIPVYKISLVGPFSHVAQNIQFAQNFMGKPSLLTRESTLKKLRRRAALKSYNNGRNKSLYTPRPAFPPSTSDGVDGSLDEYPFASTAQGGANSYVGLVPDVENEQAGTDLNIFYSQAKVKNFDNFYVQVIDYPFSYYFPP